VLRRKFTARLIWALGLLGAAIALSVSGTWKQPAAAQENLLTNGSLERPYYGQGAATRTAPQGWSMWVGAGAPEAFPHPDQVQVRDGEVSWNMKQGASVFTAAGYQQVTGLNQGDAVRLVAYGWVFTCNDTATSCVIPEAPYRRSDTSAGASLKVGIDPTGGIDPNSAAVQWSAPAAPYDQWAELSVTATAEGGTVTVFLYATQSAGLALNNVYWDQVSLVRTEAAAPAEPTQAFVPFVSPQNVRPDGSIIHVVQAGDTLSSIAYAYAEFGVTAESIAALNEGLKPNSRFLQLGQEIVVLPPGSVDPVTGQLVPGGAAAQPPAEPTSEPLPTAEAVADAPASPEPSPEAPAQPPADEQPADAAPPASDEVTTATYATLRTAFFPFENGYMFWMEDTKQIYVLVSSEDDPRTGTYSTYIDTWNEGMPETDPSLEPPSGLTQPDRSFGQAWRTYPGVRDSLGWGTGSTIYYTGLVVRDGEKTLVNGPDNRVYELNDGTWSVVDFYAPETDDAAAAE
jgi:LysM repeat protein